VHPTCQIDGQPPIPVHRPDTPAEVGEQVRTAISQGHALFPLGGRTQLALGLPPDRPGVGLDLTALAQVIDYPARDMTITVGAGITIAELQRLLASEGQRLPVDVPLPDRATLGGSIAANVSGSRRLGAGTLRDYVIGITTINDEGQQTKAGGRVVKNVAGYDLCKLHTGALGTLGIISQVTLKVRPRPETQAVLIFGCTSEALGSLAESLHASRTRPICLDILNATATNTLRRGGLSLPESPWVVLVGYEDSELAVNWQIQQLIRELTPTVPAVEALAGAVVDPLWQTLTDFALWPDARLTLKANMLPSQVPAFSLAADARRFAVHSHLDSGIVRVHVPDDLTLEQSGEMLKELTALVGDEGNIVLTRCPPEWKARLPVWGKPRNDVWLMRQVKEKLDPRRVFNPGRLF